MEVRDPSPQMTLLILLGASEWPQCPEFRSSEAFVNAARGVKDYFLQSRSFGLPAENLLDLFDSVKDADEQDQAIGQFLEQRLADIKARGNAGRDLLLYFIGHGGFTGDGHEYYLAIRRTRAGNPQVSGLQVASLAYTLKEQARQLRRIIILDCCFAAAAFSAFQAGPNEVALVKTSDAFRGGPKREGFPTKGTTLFCSSGQKSPSVLLPDYSSTMFTKAFLDALAQGTSSQQDRLSLREMKEATWDLLSEMRDPPRPVVDSPDQSEGDVADIPFFPNPRIEEERLRRAEEERDRLVEEERQRAHLAEAERVRNAEAERTRLAEEEKERARLAEVERLKKAEEEQERLHRAEKERRRQAGEAEQVRLTEEERRRQAEEKEVQRALSPSSPPDPLKSTRTPDFLNVREFPKLNRPAREFNVPPQRVWTTSTGSIQKEMPKIELSPEEKAKEEEAQRAFWSEIKTWVKIVGISVLNLLATSVGLGILLHTWWIAVVCLIGQLLLASIVWGFLVYYVDDSFNRLFYGFSLSTSTRNPLRMLSHEQENYCRREARARPTFLLVGLLPIAIAWGLVGWFLNPFGSLPLHFSYSTLILAAVGFLLGFLLGLFGNFFIDRPLVSRLRLEEY